MAYENAKKPTNTRQRRVGTASYNINIILFL
jgi:hypothetical protein